LRENQTVIYNNNTVTRHRTSNKTDLKRKTPGDKSLVICFNKDCKLRKQKSCRGFEACPGFQGK
jgi:hypothetical protein